MSSLLQIPAYHRDKVLLTLLKNMDMDNFIICLIFPILFKLQINNIKIFICEFTK